MQLLTLENLGILKDVVTIAAAGIAAYVAVMGLNTWHRQLRGGVEYDLARRLMKHTLRFRDAVRGVRSPYMWAAEHPVPTEEQRASLTQEKLTFLGISGAYQARWSKLVDARTDLAAELVEAEVLWGKESVDAFAALWQLQVNLQIVVQDYLRSINPDNALHQKEEQLDSADVMKKFEVLYGALDDPEDRFDKEIRAAVSTIQAVFSKHLKR